MKIRTSFVSNSSSSSFVVKADDVDSYLLARYQIEYTEEIPWSVGDSGDIDDCDDARPLCFSIYTEISSGECIDEHCGCEIFSGCDECENYDGYNCCCTLKDCNDNILKELESKFVCQSCTGIKNEDALININGNQLCIDCLTEQLKDQKYKIIKEQ